MDTKGFPQTKEASGLMAWLELCWCYHPAYNKNHSLEHNIIVIMQWQQEALDVFTTTQQRQCRTKTNTHQRSSEN